MRQTRRRFLTTAAAGAACPAARMRLSEHGAANARGLRAGQTIALGQLGGHPALLS